MWSAGETRRCAIRRLTASPDTPKGIERLSVERPKVKVSRMTRWQQLLWGRAGWFCLKTLRGIVHLLYLFTHNSRTYALNCSHTRRDGSAEFVLYDGAVNIDADTKHLEDVDFGTVQSVSDVMFSAAAARQSAPQARLNSSDATLVLTAIQGAPITEPLKPRTRGKKRARTADGAASGSSASSAEQDDDDAARKFNVVSSDSESNPSVDTDEDGTAPFS